MAFVLRVTKQSRKRIKPFSSISLVNCMSAFCPLLTICPSTPIMSRRDFSLSLDAVDYAEYVTSVNVSNGHFEMADLCALSPFVNIND